MNQKGFSVIGAIIGLLLLSVAVVGVAWFLKKAPEKPMDETANWKSYTNTEFGFSFKYPSDWQITEDLLVERGTLLRLTFISPDFEQTASEELLPASVNAGASLHFSVYSETPFKNLNELSEFFKLGSGGHFIKSENVTTVAGQQALTHVLGDLAKGGMRDFHVLYDNKLMTIVFSYDDSKPNWLNTLEEVLKTITLF
jgi:hypothetical protein